MTKDLLLFEFNIENKDALDWLRYECNWAFRQIEYKTEFINFTIRRSVVIAFKDRGGAVEFKLRFL